MINFHALYFPPLSGFSWPLAFLLCCKTRATGLGAACTHLRAAPGTSAPASTHLLLIPHLLDSFWTRTWPEKPKTLPKRSQLMLETWLLLLQWKKAPSKDWCGSCGASSHPTSPPWSSQGFRRLKQTPPNLPSRTILGPWISHAH